MVEIKVSNKSKVLITFQLIVLGIFLPPCIYNWFYIPYMWGKVVEFWSVFL